MSTITSLERYANSFDLVSAHLVVENLLDEIRGVRGHRELCQAMERVAALLTERGFRATLGDEDAETMVVYAVHVADDILTVTAHWDEHEGASISCRFPRQGQGPVTISQDARGNVEKS